MKRDSTEGARRTGRLGGWWGTEFLALRRKVPNGMKARRMGAIGGCEARTQCRVRSRRLRMWPRTQYRAAERGQAMECFVSLGTFENPPAGSFEDTVPKWKVTVFSAP